MTSSSTLVSSTPSLEVQAAKQKYNAEILAALASSKGEYIDGHDRGVVTPHKATHVGRFVKDGKESIVMLYDTAYFSINPLELDKTVFPHMARLSTMCIGGVVNIDKHASLENAVEAFNLSSETQPFDCGQITEIIAIAK